VKNTGKASEKAFLERMKRPGVVVERFWDQADLRGLNGGRAVGDYPKPSDFIVTENTRIFYAEVKSVQSATSFPFKNIEHGQRSAALRQAGAGGDYRMYLFSFDLGQWFIMSAAKFKSCLDDGRASVKFSELPAW
jgi:hypothetical protein